MVKGTRGYLHKNIAESIDDRMPPRPCRSPVWMPPFAQAGENKYSSTTYANLLEQHIPEAWRIGSQIRLGSSHAHVCAGALLHRGESNLVAANGIESVWFSMRAVRGFRRRYSKTEVYLAWSKQFGGGITTAAGCLDAP